MFQGKKHLLLFFMIILLILIIGISTTSFVILTQKKTFPKKITNPLIINLSKIKSKNTLYLDEVIQKRRSVRQFTTKTPTTLQISHLLWAMQGITEIEKGFRIVPSAGALYPLEIYIVKTDGVWHYLPKRHALELITKENIKHDFIEAVYHQSAINMAPIVIVITADYHRTTSKYGTRGIRYVHLEAGHAAQNLLLEAISLGLSAVTIGAFNDEVVGKLLCLSAKETPVYIIPIGYKK